MRILICDDDKMSRDQIEKYTRGFFEANHLKCPDIVCFSDGESLLADEGEMDLLFLDIEMPGMNGIYVGNELKRRNKNIIIFIITSYAEYLDEAMRFHVFRYLSKPLDRQRFLRNMKDAIDLFNAYSVRIPIETKQGIHTVSAASIIAIEAIQQRVIVHTTQRDFESVHSISYWSRILPKNRFFQTHRSYIINFEHISDFDHDLVHMDHNQYHAYLTRRKFTAFKEAYLLYLESAR